MMVAYRLAESSQDSRIEVGCWMGGEGDKLEKR